MKKIILGCLIGLFLIGCSQSEAEKQRIQKQKDEETIKEYVKENLKDPESVKFRNVNNGCGELNAKNSFGGYIGFKRFLVKPQTLEIIIEDQDDNVAFEPLWDKFCVGKS